MKADSPSTGARAENQGAIMKASCAKEKPMKRLPWLRLAALGLIAALAPGAASAQDKPLKKIYWGVTSISASNWIPWLAKEAKIYEKYGLDPELILLKGSGQTSAAILGGS